MEHPLVTAVIITHNRYELLIKAIASVKKQTYSKIELIVVDDASDSEIRERLLTQSAEENFRYIYIDKEQSRGGNHARNVGILSAQGIFVAFLDDDDEWMPEKIEKQMDVLQNNPDSQVCYCGRIKEYNFGEKLIPDDVSTLLEGDLSKEIFIKWQCLSSQIIAKKDLLIEVGLFDEALSFWQDYELCMRLFQKTKVSVVRENLVLYRIVISDPNRLTNKLVGWREAVEYIYHKHSKEMSELSKNDKKRRDINLYSDGVRRSRDSGDKKSERKYLWKLFILRRTPRDFVRAIFNVDRLNEIKFVQAMQQGKTDRG